ncbi:MAG: glycosyl transferase [Bryobacteraceae bacterium]
MAKRSAKRVARRGRPGDRNEPNQYLSRILSYLEKHSLGCLVALVLAASFRIAATYPVFNHTIDEPAHIACGMEWLDKQVYKLEVHHPPLARIMDALGPYLAGARTQGGEKMYTESPFRQGALILYAGGHYQRNLALARLGALPFFWVAAFAVYWWSRRAFGGLVATLATFLFTFLPPVLAHAGLATNDMALTAFVGAAFVSLLAWLERPSLLRSVVFGAAVALAVLSKFSALAFIPAVFACAFVWHVIARRPPARTLLAQSRALLLPFGLALLTGLLLVWTVYRFSFGLAPALGIRVPAPEFFNGIEGVLRLSRTGSPGYLLGEHGRSGWWYYYPIVLALKTPLGFLLLWIAGSAYAIRRRADAGGALALPLVFSVAILLPSLFGRVNVGVRYILPVYLGFAVTAAIGLAGVLRSAGARRWVTAGCGVLLAWFALSSLLSHPDYLPYFNELAGEEPERIVADSDLDWGQDVNRVGKRLQELEARQVAFSPFILADLSQHGWPAVTPSDPLTPSAGWNAVSITVWKIARMGLYDQYPNAHPWPDLYKPRERVGRGMLLYYFPP